MMDPINPVSGPHVDRAGEDHPVMHNPRNEARAAFFKKYKQHAPQGWPYTEDEVREANELLGLQEAEGPADNFDTGPGVADTPRDQPPGMTPMMGGAGPDVQSLMAKLMMRRLG